MQLVVGGGGKTGVSGVSGGGNSRYGSVTPSLDYKLSKNTSIIVSPTVSYSRGNGVRVSGITSGIRIRF